MLTIHEPVHLTGYWVIGMITSILEVELTRFRAHVNINFWCVAFITDIFKSYQLLSRSYFSNGALGIQRENGRNMTRK